MKHIGFLILLALVGMIACQSPTAETEEEKTQPEVLEVVKAVFPVDSVAPDGRSFHGNRIDVSEALPATQLSGVVAASGVAENITVSGELNDVCQAKGCWMTMKLDDENEMRVTFQDYGFFVPTTSSGKNATVRGTVKMDTTSIADLVHYAVDKGMSEEEAKEKYTEPEVALTFVADGVVIE